MLIHINQPKSATLIENAWLKTIEDGIHTSDIYSHAYGKKKVGTQEFATAVISRLGQKPIHFKPVNYKSGAYNKIQCYGELKNLHPKKELVGVDIFIDNPKEISANDLAAKLSNIQSPLKLIVITSRGLKIWPDSTIEAPYLRQCCCRFQGSKNIQELKAIRYVDILNLLSNIDALELEIVEVINLYTFDNQIGFTLAQGQ